MILGGCDHHEAVNPPEVWSPEPGLAVPPPPITSCARPASVYRNGSIILCGGPGIGTTPCYSHTLGTSTWEDFPPLSVHRERFSMTTVGDKIVVVGGFKSGCDIEIYKDEKWAVGPELQEYNGIIHHCAVG